MSTNELFASIVRPNPVETDYTVSRIEGEIPRELNGTLVQHGQYSRHAQANGTCVFVGVRVASDRTPTEELRVGGELSVNLQPNNGFKIGHAATAR